MDREDRLSLPEEVMALVDGEVDEGEARRLRARIAAEPSLGDAERSLRALDRLLGHHPEVVVSAGFAERVLKAARAAPPERPLVHRGFRFARWPLAAAAAAVVVWVALPFLVPRGEAVPAEIPLRDYGVLAAVPESAEGAASLDAAVREIEAVDEIFLRLS